MERKLLVHKGFWLCWCLHPALTVLCQGHMNTLKHPSGLLVFCNAYWNLCNGCLAFYEEIQRTLSFVLSVCLFWGLSHQMRWQSAALPGVPCWRLWQEKKKYVGTGLGMAEGWETLTNAKARRVCHINNVSGHKYFKTMMVKSQNCTLLDYCCFYLCMCYTKWGLLMG